MVYFNTYRVREQPQELHVTERRVKAKLVQGARPPQQFPHYGRWDYSCTEKVRYT